MITSTCPSRETLFQYSVGVLDGEQRDALDEHLEDCPECQATIMTLDDADDTVAGRLRTPPSSESFLAEPELHEALATAMAMPLTSPRAKGDAGRDGFAADMPWTLGEYRVLEELGRGGMGRVYKALHTKLDRVVAVKILSRGRGADPQALSRFEREMRAVGKISHPNVVHAYDAREIDGMPVIIMEYVEGLDLAEIVRRCTHHGTHHAPRDGFPHVERDEYGGVPVAEACELARRTALALQCAHEHGLVHRDIKPSNIMLTPAGEVKLLDLGLARFYAEGGSSLSPLSDGEEMTGTGQAMGTADYMAPEQASDSRTVDIRADIYSLGCTLYKLLSGRAPFSGAAYRSTLDKLNAHVRQPVPPIRGIVPDVPAELAVVLDRMLAKDPGQRFATPADVAAALAQFCRDANLTNLLDSAIATDNGPLSFRERARVRAVSAEDFEAGSHPSPQLAPAPPRRSVLRRILIGLGFFGAMAAAFAAGIIITIKKNGENYQLEVQKDSRTVVDKDGNATVEIAGKPESPKPTTTKNNGGSYQVEVPESSRKVVKSEGATEGPAVNPEADLKPLQGQWKVVRVEKGANTDRSWGEICQYQSPLDPATTSRIDFCVRPENNLLIIASGSSTKPTTTGTAGAAPQSSQYLHPQDFDFRLDPSASPKRIDLLGDPGGAPGVREAVALGIYEFEGEQLKIRLAGRKLKQPVEEQRPKDFSIEPGSGEVVFVLEQYRAEDEKKIRGLWAVVTEMTNGVAIPEQNLSVAECRFDEAYVSSNWMRSRSEMTAPFVLAPTKEPRQITFAVLKTGFGASRFQSLYGIYRLDPDGLRIAYRPNGPPPEKFESTPGSGVTLLVLQRPDVLAAAPPEVAVVRPVVRQITDHVDFTGQTEAAQTAEVRSRLSGHLAKVLFQPGSTVKQGDMLFEIDPAPFQTEVDKREAEVRLLQLRVDRAKTGQERTAFDEAEAALATAQQGLKVARLNLDSTRLTAPISGRIGRPLVAVGSLVTDAMPLAAIDSVDPVCVAFKVGERTLLELRRNPPRLQGQSALPVLVGLIDEKGYPHKSQVESAETRLDPATATARWRALLPNPDGILLPGMFVRVRLVTSDPYQALLVPQKAVFDKSQIRDVQTPDGPRYSGKLQYSVFIVTEHNVVQGRDVEYGLRDDDGMLVVKKGLNAEDWVIENGIGYIARDHQGGSFVARHNTLLQGMTVKPLKPPTAASPSTSNGSPPATGPAAELKLYGGKTFEQWRDLARTDLDRETRVKAFTALGAFAGNGKSDDAVAAIREALKVDQPYEALEAAYAELRQAGPQAETAIINGIRHKDPAHRKAAIEALHKGGGQHTYAVSALLDALADPDPGIRADASHALAHIAVATEYEVKDGQMVRLRPEGEIGPTTKVVVPALARLLKDAGKIVGPDFRTGFEGADPTVKGEAARSLDEMGPLAKDAIPELIAFVEADFAKIKATTPGRQGSHERTGPAVEMWYGVMALGKMGPAASAAVPLLTTIAETDIQSSPGTTVEVAAQKALGQIQGKPARESRPGGNRRSSTKPVGPKGGGSRRPAGGTNGPAAAGSPSTSYAARRSPWLAKRSTSAASSNRVEALPAASVS